MHFSFSQISTIQQTLQPLIDPQMLTSQRKQQYFDIFMHSLRDTWSDQLDAALTSEAQIV